MQEKGAALSEDGLDLFKGKRVLDIGCHVGATALQVAAHYAPESILGIDIDPKLIKAAISNLHKIINA